MRTMPRLLTTLFALLALTAVSAPSAGAQSAGDVLWKFPVPDFVHGKPVVDATGNLYFGCMNGKLYCLDAAGNLQWSYAAGAPLRGTPKLDHNGMIYVSDQQAYCHKVRVSDGSRIWRVNLAGALHSDATPAISHDGSLVFFGTVDTAQSGRLFALSTSDGSVQWTGKVLQWSSSLYDRFERNDILMAPNGDVVAMGWDAGSLVSFQMDGTESWSVISAFNNYPSNFVIDPQGRVFGYSYWGFRAFDSSGSLAWDKWYYLYAGNDALVVGPRDLIFAGYGGRIRGHDRDNGDILWSETFSFGAIQVAWEPVRQLVYAVGTDFQNRQIIALNQFGAVQWQAPWPGFANRAPVASSDGSVLYIADQDGAIYAISTGPVLPTLDLTAGLLIRGLATDITVQAAQAGETVHYLYSLTGTGVGPCPGQLGGLCLDILSPIHVLGTAVADTNGKAVLRTVVPAQAPQIDVHFQAVAQRGSGGSASAKSNTVTSPIF